MKRLEMPSGSGRVIESLRGLLYGGRGTVVLIVGATAALALLLIGLGSSPQTRKAAQADRTSARHVARAVASGGSTGVDDLGLRFRQGFHDRADALCRRTLGSTTCEPSAFWNLPDESREADLEGAFNETRGSVGRWLTRLGVMPAFPSRDVPWAARFLTDEARGSGKPFTTLVAVEVLRLLPELAGPGLLQALVSEPFPSTTVRFAALDALAAGPRPEDVPFLRGLLDSEDTRDSRRALRALAASDRGAPLLIAWLREHVDAVPEGLKRDLALSLRKAGALQDRALVGELLRSRDQGVVQAVLRSVTGAADHAEDEPLPAELAGSLSLLSRDADASTRRLAISAFSGLGESGEHELQSIAKDGTRPAAERIQAGLSLLDLDPAAAATLSPELIRAAGNAREAYRAARLAVTEPAALDEAIAELRRWMALHPNEAGALVDLMAYGNEDALIARVDELQLTSTGGSK